MAIGKETGRRVGMGTNLYPSSSLLENKDDATGGVPVDELIEKADGFAGVFPGYNLLSNLNLIIWFIRKGFVKLIQASYVSYCRAQI